MGSSKHLTEDLKLTKKGNAVKIPENFFIKWQYLVPERSLQIKLLVDLPEKENSHMMAREILPVTS